LTLHVTLARSPADNSPNENGVIAGGTETHPYAHTQATTQLYITSPGLVGKRTSSRDGKTSLIFLYAYMTSLTSFQLYLKKLQLSRDAFKESILEISETHILLAETNFTLDVLHPANFLLFPPQITCTMCLISSMHLYWGGKSKIIVPCTCDTTTFLMGDDVNFKIQLIQVEDRQCFFK
jgi:hypothetical protein